MSRRRPVLVVLALAAAAGAGAGGLLDGAGDADEAPGGHGERGRVVKVVDGDTIHVQLGRSAREKVRYIGVDTPETKDPRRPVQCFGQAAADFNARLVAGEPVRLQRDVEHRDRYGRLLAYVFRARDGLFVNAELVRRGFAQPLTIAPNVRYAERFAALARDAREDGRGLWSAC